MLALDAHFSGIDPLAWRHLARLLMPPGEAQRAVPAEGGGAPAEPPLKETRSTKARGRPLLLFIERGHLVQVLRHGQPLDFPAQEAERQRLAPLWRGGSSLPALRRAARAPWAVAGEDDGLFLLSRAVEERLRPGDDLLAQGLAAAEAARQFLGGKLHADPNPFPLGLPRPDQVRRAADLLLPDGRSVILYIAEGRQVWTSLVLGKRHGAISHVTTHMGLVPPSALSGDLRHDARVLAQAASARVAPPHLGIFITLRAWRQVVGPPPGALARAAATGEAVLDPLPAWMLAATGLGAATGIARETGKLLGRFLPRGVVDMARQVGQAGLGPFQALGIDPLELWQRLTRLARGEDP